MEKRLFLAVLLSLGVVFLFQSLFGPKPGATAVTQNSQSNISATTSAVVESIDKETVVEKATSLSFKEEVKTIDLGRYTLDISNNGGKVQKVYLKELNYEFPIDGLAEMAEANGKKFVISEANNKNILMTAKTAGLAITRSIKVDGFKLIINNTIENTTSAPLTINNTIKSFGIDLSRLDKNTKNSDWTLFEYALRTPKGVERKEQVHNFNSKWNKEESKHIEWISFRDRYFVTIVKPNEAYKKYSVQFKNDSALDLGSGDDAKVLAANAKQESTFTIYAGPQKLEDLKKVDPDFQKTLVFSSWGWLDAIAKAIYWMLKMIHKIIPIWGLAIVLVSLLVYGLMYPLTYKSMMSMKKMQAVQPKMAQLKEKYKNNPERLNKEIVELYKQENINPLSGCLPLLLQMPIFVGLYQVLWRSYYFRGEGFLWIKDLSMPDRLFKLPFEIPFLGEYINILPILMIFIMLAQQLITLKNMSGGDPEQVAQQRIMAYFFPVFLGFIFYNFSSGLNIYFVVFYALSAFSQWKVSSASVVKG